MHGFYGDFCGLQSSNSLLLPATTNYPTVATSLMFETSNAASLLGLFFVYNFS